MVNAWLAAARNAALIAARYRCRWDRVAFVQRKVFRIEAMLGKPRAHAPASAPAPSHQTNPFAEELNVLREMIARSERELATLRNGASLPRMQNELAAAIGDMDQGTHKVLRCAEAIDESARALCATLVDDYKRGLAQEVFEQASHIYEACNFQDLAGQRINKAIAALKLVEQQMARLYDLWGGMKQASGPSAPDKLVNGPKLEGDSGHADQSEIDRMFAVIG
jgi:chemotaxis protein CheZ